MNIKQLPLKLKNILYISIFLLVVLVFWTGINRINKPESVNINDEGSKIVDLTARDFESTVYFSDGSTKNADSYPEKLYTPADFAAGATVAPQTLPAEKYREIQYMTHRLRFKLPAGEAYGISMRSCDFSMRLFLNGKEIDCVGLPGTTKETSVPRTADRTYYFTPANETVELIVQTSNFVHRDGNYSPAFSIGTQQNIIKNESHNQFISTIIIGCLLLAFLYHLALFLLNRNRKAVLIFSVCCFLLMLMSSQTFIPLFLPNYNWFWAFRIEYIVHFLTFAFLTLLLRTLYPLLLNKIVAWSYYSLSGLYILSTFIFEPAVYSGFLLYYQVVSVLMIIYVLVRLAMMLKGGKLQNLLSFAGVLVLCLFGLNDILYHNTINLFGNFAGQTFRAPIGMIFFVLCYAMALSLDMAETERRLLQSEQQVAEIQERINAMIAAEHTAEADAPKPINLTDYGLSKREADVAWLLIDGKTRKEIAALLDLSVNTVNTYCRRIFEKTNSGSVTELYKNLGIIQR